MFLATVNQPRQLLVTRYIDAVDAEELQRGLLEVRELLATLSPGFTLLVDLSQLAEMDAACASQIGLFMEHFTHAGLGRVVRVIPDGSKDIGFNILGAFHYPKDLPVANCQSFAEAAHLLEP